MSSFWRVSPALRWSMGNLKFPIAMQGFQCFQVQFLKGINLGEWNLKTKIPTQLHFMRDALALPQTCGARFPSF